MKNLSIIVLLLLSFCNRPENNTITNDSVGDLRLGQLFSEVVAQFNPIDLDTVFSDSGHEKFLLVNNMGQKELRFVFNHDSDTLKEIWVYTPKYTLDNLNIGSSYSEFSAKNYSLRWFEKWNKTVTTSVEEFPNITIYFENKPDSTGELSLYAKITTFRLIVN